VGLTHWSRRVCVCGRAPGAQFRQMWAEFEWENKVLVNTNITYVAGGARAPRRRDEAHT